MGTGERLAESEWRESEECEERSLGQGSIVRNQKSEKAEKKFDFSYLLKPQEMFADIK